MSEEVAIEQGVFEFAKMPDSGFLDGRDEMNFAEFPVASVTTRKTSQISICFEDEIFDKKVGKTVPRKLTVTGNAEFGGLPNATDDQILLGLIQLTRIRGFVSRTVHFSRYELIRILGWKDKGKCYSQIRDSLNRWKATVLTYENSWRDKESATWATESFSAIDNYKLAAGNGVTRSSFTWNKVVFKSFRSGNIKSLDFGTFTTLELPVTRRIYRFLDKRFYINSTQTFDLADFAYNKVGLARSYPVAEIKRKLTAPIEQLEEIGFIKPVKKRFERIAPGKYKIHFAQAKRARKLVPDENNLDDQLISQLINYGVTAKRAQSLVGENPGEFIAAKLELLHYYQITDGHTDIKDPANWLCAAIDDDYQPPANFTTRLQRDEEEKARIEKQESLDVRKRKEVVEKAESEQRETEVFEQAELELAQLDEATREKMDSEIKDRYQSKFQNLSPDAINLLRCQWIIDYKFKKL